MPRPAAGATGALPVVPADEPAPHLRARRRSRRAFGVWIAVVLVLALLVGVTAWWLGSGRWTAMPTIVGVEQAVAERLLADADLVPTVTTAYDDAVAAGVVAAADPRPDERLLRGSTVSLTVSTGRPTVPAIAPGVAVADAEQAIREAMLRPVQSTTAAEYSATVPAGAVVRTTPGAGTALPLGGTVTLVVSRGPEPPPEPVEVRVPLLIGDRFDEAADALDDLGLEASERAALPFAGRDNGRVIGQDPGPGSLVERGTTVTLDTL